MLFQPKCLGAPAATQKSPTPALRLSIKGSMTYAAMLCAAAASTISQASNWPQYAVIPIAKMNNARNFSLALNNYARIAGNTKTSNPTESLGLLGGAGVASSSVGLPPQATFLSFLGINDSNLAVGYANEGGYPQAVYTLSGLTVRLFNPTKSNPGSEAIAVNNSDTILGWDYRIEDGREHVSMFQFNPTTNAKFEWPDTYAGGINDQDVIASSPDDYELGQQPELQLKIDTYTGDDYDYYPPATYGRVFPSAISAGSANPYQWPVSVVGEWETPTANGTGTKRNGFLFTQFNKNWYSMLDPSGHNYETDPLAIDPGAQFAVGYALDKNGNHSAAGWANTHNHMDWAPEELHDVLGNPAGWQFTDATGINEYDAITGYGVYNGVPTSFIAIPAQFYRFTLANLSVVGGQTVKGQLQLTVPIGTSLTFRGGSSSELVTMPRTVTLSNDEPQTFTIQTQPVTRQTTVTLVMSLGGIEQTAKLTVNPSTRG